jgi:PAS domain S-box-containing protein
MANKPTYEELEQRVKELENEASDRRQAEVALQASEEKSRALSEAAFEAIFLSEKGICLGQNLAAEKMFGYTPSEIIGMPGTEWIAPDSREMVRNNMLSGYEKPYEAIALRKDGSTFPTEIQGKMIFYQGREIRVTSQCDITDRVLAEEALRESEERFRTVADFTHDWESWIAPDGHHIYVSPSCERITGYSPEEFVNDPGLLIKIVHPDDNSIVVDHLGEEQSLKKLPSMDFRIITRSGEERWISHNCQAVYGADGRYLGRRASNRNISKRKKMEEEALKAKKLESLGVLAGGIAHDFNNLMSAVVGNISLARMAMKPGSKAFRNLVEAEKASIRTKELTSRLITFSKGGGPIKETVSIGALVKDSVRASLKVSDIDAEFSIPDDISPVDVDEDQMKQAIRNIIINAQEAMAGQGTINVSCENADIGVKDTLTLKDGKYVKISIEDQGPGIPEEDLIKIFDPYFSTKEMGAQKGMGLGLAVSDSIIKQHDGLITVKSELGTGTTFHIYLPAITAKRPSEIGSALHGAGEEPSTEHVLKQSSIINHSRFQRDLRSAPTIKRILVMDDEEMLRDVSSAMLSKLGYEVKVAIDGVEAIEMYKKARESGEPYDAVILDLTNNVGMGGVEAIKKLLEIDPEIRAIVATGYSFDPVVENYRAYGFRGAITKPFGMDELSKVVKRVISSG